MHNIIEIWIRIELNEIDKTFLWFAFLFYFIMVLRYYYIVTLQVHFLLMIQCAKWISCQVIKRSNYFMPSHWAFWTLILPTETHFNIISTITYTNSVMKLFLFFFFFFSVLLRKNLTKYLDKTARIRLQRREKIAS